MNKYYVSAAYKIRSRLEHLPCEALKELILGYKIQMEKFIFFIISILISTVDTSIPVIEDVQQHKDKYEIVGSNSKFCNFIKYITPHNPYQTNKNINEISKSICSNNILSLSHDKGVFYHEIRTERVIFSSTDCFIILIDENETLHSITSLFERNNIPWNYKTKIFLICEFACSTNNFLLNFNSSKRSDDLINALLIDLRSNRHYQVCASSKSIEEYDLLEAKDITQSKYMCPVNLHGETVPVLIYDNPPMANIRRDVQKSYKSDWPESAAVDNFIGLEPEIMKTMMKMFNFRIHLKNHVIHGTNITNLSNYSDVRIAINMLIKGDIQIMANFQPRELVNNSNITYTQIIYNEEACLVIDKSLFTKSIVNLYKIFQPSVYVALAVTFISVAIAWITITKLTESSRKNYGSIVVILISVISGSNIYR